MHCLWRHTTLPNSHQQTHTTSTMLDLYASPHPVYRLDWAIPHHNDHQTMMVHYLSLACYAFNTILSNCRSMMMVPVWWYCCCFSQLNELPLDPCLISHLHQPFYHEIPSLIHTHTDHNNIRNNTNTKIYTNSTHPYTRIIQREIHTISLLPKPRISIWASFTPNCWLGQWPIVGMLPWPKSPSSPSNLLMVQCVLWLTSPISSFQMNTSNWLHATRGLFLIPQCSAQQNFGSSPPF